MSNIASANNLVRGPLAGADATLRLFITAFLILLTCGYVIGLFFVDHTTAGTPRGLTEEFRGAPEDSQEPEFKYAKTVDEMYIFLHNHIISLSMIFFAVGGLFYFTGFSPRLKGFLVVEPFAAIATTFGGIWLMRYVSEHFSWLVLVSGISMVGCYFLMVALIMKELWMKRS